MRLVAVWAAVSVLAVGCVLESPLDRTIIATSNVGDVSVEMLAGFAGTMSEADRKMPLDSAARAIWLRTRVADMLYEQHLESLASADTSEDVDISAEDEAGIVVDTLIRWAGAQEHTSDVVPELAVANGLSRRRLVYHYFRRIPESEERDSGVEALNRLRDDMKTLDDFIQLIREESDSESAEVDGSLGWVSHEGPSTPLKETIFSLPVREVSAPVVTRDGIHMFFVADEVVPAQVDAFSHADAVYAAQYARRALHGMGDGEAHEYEQIANAGESDYPGQTLIAGDGWNVSEGLYQLWKGRIDPAARVEPQIVLTDLAKLMHRGFDDPLVVTEIEDRVREKRTESYYKKIALQRIARDEESVQAHYSRYITRYSTAPKWMLKVLRIPVENDYPTTLAVLEKAFSQRQSIAEVSALFGKETPEAVTLSLSQIVSISPQFAYQVTSAEPGAITRPRIVAGEFVIGEPISKTLPEPLPFEQVRSRVALDMFNTLGRDLYGQMRDEYALSIGLQVHPEHLSPHR